MEKIIAIFTILLFVFIVLAIVLAPFTRFSSVGSGEHRGYITAVDQRGYIFQNYDVFFKTDNSSSQEDTYCIDRNDASLIEKAKEANQKRTLVTLKYHGVKGIGLGLCEGTQIDAIQ